MAKRRAQTRGFTLVELIVGVGLFALLTLLITTAFFHLTNVQRNIDSKQQILNDFRTAVDVMVKEMTSGSAFPSGCDDTGCSNIIFVTKARPDMPQRNVEYRLNTTTKTIEKAEQKTYGLCAVIPFDSKCFQPFHSGDVDVESLTFYVENKLVAYTQPMITIQMQGVINPGTREQEDFKITTSVTPRMLQDPSATPPTDNVFPLVNITSPTSATTYSTGNSSISLGGTASDNVGITAMRWRNEATGSEGIINAILGGNVSWGTASITLKPAVTNTIVIEAEDSAGNIGTDQLDINSTALPPPPGATGAIDAYQDCGPVADINVYAGCSSGATNIYYYRCSTPGCTPSDTDYDQTAIRNNCTAWYDPAVSIGGMYSYRARGYDSASGQFGPWSGVDTHTMIAPYACPPPAPPAPAQCNDGIDNDGDGGTDMSDPDCSSTSDNTETGTPPPPPPVPGYSLSASPIWIKAMVGGTTTGLRQSTSSTIRVNPEVGFGSLVSLSIVAGAPAGTQQRFSPGQLGPGLYSSGSSFFVNIPDNTPLGTYTMTVRGTSQNGIVRDTFVTLVVGAVGGGQE